MGVRLPAALKEINNVVVKEAFDTYVKKVEQTLAGAGISSAVGYIAYAGRTSAGTGQVQVNIPAGGYASTWAEWAYAVAEEALHFNKKVWVIYKDQPFGNNLLQVLCMKESV